MGNQVNVFLFDRCTQGEARLNKTKDAILGAARSAGIDLKITPCSRPTRFGTEAGADELLLGEGQQYSFVVVNEASPKAEDVLVAGMLHAESRGLPTHRVISLHPGKTSEHADGYTRFAAEGGNGHLTTPNAQALVTYFRTMNDEH